jgi:predicted nucleic acid-binding protein
MIEVGMPVALTGMVITEIAQGLTRDARPIETYLSDFQMLEPQGFSTYLNAAAIFRTARSKGISLATIDALIAAIALENNATLFTLDQDFSRIAQITSLRLHEIVENQHG